MIRKYLNLTLAMLLAVTFSFSTAAAYEMHCCDKEQMAASQMDPMPCHEEASAPAKQTPKQSSSSCCVDMLCQKCSTPVLSMTRPTEAALLVIAASRISFYTSPLLGEALSVPERPPQTIG